MGRLRACQQNAADTQLDKQVTSPGPSSSSNKGFTGTGDHIDDYGDRSTSYWPPGWNFERYRNCEQSDLLALPRDELTKLLNGFHEVLGEVGNLKMAQVVGENEKLRKEQENAGPAISSVSARVPDWLHSYQKRFTGQKWGFVVCKVGDHEDQQWKKYKERVETIVRLPFSKDGGVSAVEEAEALFHLRWVEDNSIEAFGTQQLQEEFANITTALPLGFPRQLFFVATPQSVSHVLTETIPDANAQRWRESCPYILAIPSKGASKFEETPAKVFKVALETVVEELWMLLTDLSWSAAKVSRGTDDTQLFKGREVSKADYGEDELPDVWWTSAPPPSLIRKRRRVK